MESPTTTHFKASQADPFLAGGGDAGALIRSIEWSKTSLGPIDAWPRSLKISIRILLDCKLPMCLAWGPEYIQFYNDAYRPILGDKVEGAMGGRTPEIWSEIWPTIGPMWQEVWNGRSLGFEDFKLTINRFGYEEDCYFNFSYSSVPNDEGEVGGILVTFAETTTRFQTEQALTLEREKLLSLFMQAPVGICVLEGPDHVYTLTNPVWYSIMAGGMAREILGKPARAALPELEDQGFFNLLDEVYQTGKPYFGTSSPVDLALPDGSARRVYLDFVYTPKRNAAGAIDGVLCVFTDVTERQTSIQKLHEEQQMREQFVATLTHDLRNPLSAAKVCAQVLAKLTHSPEKQAVLSGRIIESLNRANKMIENLLDTSRIKAGQQLSIEIEELELRSLITETLADLATVHGDRFVLECEKERVDGQWSSDGIKRILENLCNNAVKYGDPRTPVAVEIQDGEGEVRIAVVNQGAPIAPEKLGTLFQPFQRAEVSPSIQGWGLGLTLVKGLVEAHQGEITVTSDAETGTRFVVRLPMRCTASVNDPGLTSSVARDSSRSFASGSELGQRG